jgi:hypothetical protein
VSDYDNAPTDPHHGGKVSQSMRDYLEQRERVLEARVDALWKAISSLEPFARHMEDCGGGDGGSQCQCGYAAAHAAAQEAKSQ